MRRVRESLIGKSLFHYEIFFGGRGADSGIFQLSFAERFVFAGKRGECDGEKKQEGERRFHGRNNLGRMIARRVEAIRAAKFP